MESIYLRLTHPSSNGCDSRTSDESQPGGQELQWVRSPGIGPVGGNHIARATAGRAPGTGAPGSELPVTAVSEASDELGSVRYSTSFAATVSAAAARQAKKKPGTGKGAGL